MILLEYIGIVFISILVVVLYKKRIVGSNFLKLGGIAAGLSLTWELAHYVKGLDFLKPSEEIQNDTSMIGYSLSHAFYDTLIFLALAGAAIVLFGKQSIFSWDLRVLFLYILLGFAQEVIVEVIFAEKLKTWKYKISETNPEFFRGHAVIAFIEWFIAPALFWLFSGLI